MESSLFAPLNGRQALIAAAIGVALWFAAAELLNTLIPLGALDGSGRAVTYALIIPGSAPFVWLIARLLRLSASQVAPALALATGAAALCDGIALGWYPALYAADTAGAHLAGAAILWGAGVAIVLGFLMARRVGK